MNWILPKSWESGEV